MNYAAISPHLLQQSDARIAPYQLARMVHKIMRDGDDEFMGLATNLSRFGLFTLLCERLIHCSNLREALQEASRFYQLTTGSLVLQLEEQKELCHLTILLAQPSKDPHCVLTELLLLIWHRFPSWLISEVIPLHAVHLSMKAPDHQQEYRLLFHCRSLFDQPLSRLTFPSNFLNKPIQKTPEQLQRYLAKVPLVWFRKLHFVELQTDRVINLLKSCDSLQTTTLEEIASQLHMTSRTLRRRLTAEGTQFQVIKDGIRRDRAIYWLTQHRLSIKETAQKAGYTETASFIRAFKNWTGLSPGQYKKEFTSK